MKCPICNGKSIKYKEIHGNINIPDDSNIYILSKCITCAHIHRINYLSANIYFDNYYAYNADKLNHENLLLELFTKSSTSIFYKLLWDIIQNMTRFQNMPYITNGKVLDIGGGDGFALNLYKKLSNKTYNVEINKYAIEKSKKNGHKSFSTLEKLPKIKFDLIRINQVLEHLADPKDTILFCKNNLADNGKIIIGIPNINASAFNIFGHNFDQLSLPDHIHFFSEQSIKILLKDFAKVKISYPMHKYGIVTNFYNLLVIRKWLPFNKFLLFLAIIFGVVVNIPSKLVKKTHFINIECSNT